MLPVIKWSGSKRHQANKIVAMFPPSVGRYYEPFVGGGAVLAKTTHFHDRVAGDVCEPLVALWKIVQSEPKTVADSYRRNWNRLQRGGGGVYYEIRERFNQTSDPLDLFFLCRTSYLGLIRFSKEGKFNAPFHFSRPGIHPDKLEKVLADWSNAVSGVRFVCGDYRATTSQAGAGDLIYCDPPYLHTRGMYRGGIDFDGFVRYLAGLNNGGVRWAVSFDGVVEGETPYVVDFPKALYARHILIRSGISSFRRMKGKIRGVKESLYLNY